MIFSLYSLLTTILWSSLLFITIFSCRRSIIFIRNFGISSLLIIFIACIIRLLIPLEFSFTQEIPVPKLLNSICTIAQITPIPKSKISLASILLMVWVVVAIGLFIRVAIIYTLYMKKLSKLPSNATQQMNEVAAQVFLQKDRTKLKIILHPQISVPMICGFHKGTILLPFIEYTDQELNFILKHEYTHFKNKDAYVRLMVDLFCACFWWNPFVYFIKLDLDNILEMKCDRGVIEGRSKEEIVFYSEMLMKFLEQRTSKKTPFITSEFSNDNAMIQRFKLLFEPMNIKKQRHLSVFIGVVLWGILLFSYMFVFQSQYIPDTKNESTNEFLTIEKNFDGTFNAKIYANGEETMFIISEEEKNRMEVNGINIKFKNTQEDIQ